MANSSEQKATDDLDALAPEFAKLTQDFLFLVIFENVPDSRSAIKAYLLSHA